MTLKGFKIQNLDGEKRRLKDRVYSPKLERFVARVKGIRSKR
jgi:hypothetical protein